MVDSLRGGRLQRLLPRPVVAPLAAGDHHGHAAAHALFLAPSIPNTAVPTSGGATGRQRPAAAARRRRFNGPALLTWSRGQNGTGFAIEFWIYPEEFILNWVPEFKRSVFKRLMRDFFKVKPKLKGTK